jgi:hypothetical protein
MHISSLIKVVFATTGALSSISLHLLLLDQNSPILSIVPQENFTANLQFLVYAYNAELDMLCNRHKMYQRIYFIYSNLDSFLDEDFIFMMNNWDKELVQFKLHSELNCTKFKSCHIE